MYGFPSPLQINVALVFSNATCDFGSWITAHALEKERKKQLITDN